MNAKQLDEVLTSVVSAIKKAMDARIQEAEARADEKIKRIEERLAELLPSDEIERLIKSALSDLPKPADGKDAAQIEVLANIDPEKTYMRGIYATHDGGLWRAYEQTSGMRGWECIVNGIKAVSVEYDGNRDFTLKIEKTFGDAQVNTFTTPMLIDKGIFKAQSEYQRFDVVSYGGSMWIAQKDAPEGAPGNSDDWRLSVKRGRDSKEKVRA